jgi:transposase
MNSTAAASKSVKYYISSLEKENNELKNSLKNNVIQFKSYEDEVKQLKEEKTVLEEKNKKLKEGLRLALLRQFNKHAERFTEAGQLFLFDGGEQAAPKTEPESKETIPVKSHERKKRGRKPLSEDLPREHTYLDIEEEDKHCACGHELTCIGEEVSERLHIIPPQIFVEVIHKKKYACHECEGSGDEDKPAVRMAETPGNIMPGSIATPGLLSFIFTQKYCDYLPFYRQEAAFRRIGVEISRQNMSNWQQGVCKKLIPLLELLKAHIKTGGVVQMDETTMLVMDEPGRENKQKSYMWLARGGPPDKKAVWYEYHESRSSKHIPEILRGYSGFLQTDGYEAYSTALKDLPDIIHVGCFAHVRRGFFEALKINSGSGGASSALSQIKGLYTNETALREKLKRGTISPEKFLAERKEACEPILSAFHDWLEKEQREVLGSSRLGEAVSYTLGQWTKLICYLDHVELTPDNNACERSIRPFVMGRKNWVVSGSPEGAQSSCQLFSLIETAKTNNRNPYAYLKKVFELAAKMSTPDNWEKLLPWNLDL